MVVLDRGKFDKNQYRIFNIKTVVGADDFRSMAEAVDRRYRRLLEEAKALPDLILIDGGRGQLNAALAALNKLGVEEIPVAGLAKREEEIYVPDRDEPIRLERHDVACSCCNGPRRNASLRGVFASSSTRETNAAQRARRPAGHRREAQAPAVRALRQRVRDRRHPRRI
jgi:hypothetical protein